MQALLVGLLQEIQRKRLQSMKTMKAANLQESNVVGSILTDASQYSVPAIEGYAIEDLDGSLGSQDIAMLQLLVLSSL